MKALQVRLDDEQHRQLRAVSFRDGVSLNQLIRIAINDMLDRKGEADDHRPDAIH